MRIVNYTQFNESLRNDKLNTILSKISDGIELNNSERNFLDNYESIKEDDLRSYTHLNCSDIYDKINTLLSSNKDITYQDSVILDIRYIENDICIITKDGSIKLKDNYLYNITLNDDDTYTLSIQDEYFEKLPLNND